MVATILGATTTELNPTSGKSSMSELPGTPRFAVISGADVRSALDGRAKDVLATVEAAYRLHGGGDTVNPPSYFLRFPDRPDARIIALPASLGGDEGVDGLKWISSFPANIATGLPRASAVLILNDPKTGYPYACLESSIISAARTAASAALAADVLSRDRGPRPTKVGFVGTGLIARYVHQYLVDSGWTFTDVGVHDQQPESAQGYRDYLSRATPDARVTVHDSAEDLVRGADLVVFATTSAQPHVTDPGWFDHHPLVLHVSLRDLGTDVIGEAVNVVDDIDHCLRANTSVHLYEQQVGNREFVAGTLDDVLNGSLTMPADRTVVFSPFGLGVLDLAVGRFVYDETERAGRLRVIEDFFAELSRHG